MDRAWRSLAYLCAGTKVAVANGSTLTSGGEHAVERTSAVLGKTGSIKENGGENRAMEIADFPRLGKRMITEKGWKFMMHLTQSASDHSSPEGTPE
ncbi:MAG TPA: hypothetical protein VHM64_25315 [Candidatus Binatia bacterium]|nr:hypothetical protein [Candidatus Binatia bacterium]